MSLTFEQIILDAKRVANRLKDREALGDSLLLETEAINKQMESMRLFEDDIDILNKLARERSNNQLITIIHQENPQIREIQQENRLLKAALEDHQHALDFIMSKYREHTQSKILNTKVNFVEAFSKHQQFSERKDEVIRQQTNKIQEMAAVMQRASQIDEEKFNQEQEFVSKLMTENKGLRELLEISQKYGSNGQRILVDEKSTQTDTFLLDDYTASDSASSLPKNSCEASTSVGSVSNTGTIKISPSSSKTTTESTATSTVSSSLPVSKDGTCTPSMLS
ncbi:FGFR1 oncogene partner 2 homolog [Wyeomyia smithii]|uniref:FGFR1 oncogene partner 2 homolog n=1 Tax=Wyeomyia smithii TaxID=174621 RepID=UPI002467D3E9|nr:FGFR1 oncogene partner 2 homolog [Wyeomyia smithii]XP_055531757.1 FGFR1 oncogene partner 2 homolog [Wyeomyia smithii]XP_055531759.1 FGFR1 oncogene partner 2 homolog [Wyeomyia smithii]XP_055531760.1 FGFR1 oncogene partner 2 homolog [Wyeomyia smithii]